MHRFILVIKEIPLCLRRNLLLIIDFSVKIQVPLEILLIRHQLILFFYSLMLRFLVNY